MSHSEPLPFAAVDLGASSGRVMVGHVSDRGAGTLRLDEVHRFPNRPVRTGATLHWDILSLYAGVLDGLRAAGAATGRAPASVGIDTWAVDYGLLDASGALLGNPVHYRDTRTEGQAEKVGALLGPAALYAATGLQYLPFNTVYQLTAAKGTAALDAAKPAAADPRSDRLLAHRRGRYGAHQRLHHPAHRPPHPGLVPGRGGGARHRSGAVRAAARPRRSGR